MVDAKVYLTDFQPGKHTLKKGDVPLIVREFERFLSHRLVTNGESKLPAIEIEQEQS